MAACRWPPCMSSFSQNLNPLPSLSRVQPALRGKSWQDMPPGQAFFTHAHPLAGHPLAGHSVCQQVRSNRSSAQAHSDSSRPRCLSRYAVSTQAAQLPLQRASTDRCTRFAGSKVPRTPHQPVRRVRNLIAYTCIRALRHACRVSCGEVAVVRWRPVCAIA